MATDENRRAYYEVMRGNVPTSVSPNSHPYVAFRLMKLRFVDIILALEDNTSMEKGKGKSVESKILVSGLKSIVS